MIVLFELENEIKEIFEYNIDYDTDIACPMWKCVNQDANLSIDCGIISQNGNKVTLEYAQCQNDEDSCDIKSIYKDI